jgi:hypothetical protein
MATAVDQGMKLGIAGCLSKGPTYGQHDFLTGAVDCKLVTFAVEKGMRCTS